MGHGLMMPGVQGWCRAGAGMTPGAVFTLCSVPQQDTTQACWDAGAGGSWLSPN